MDKLTTLGERIEYLLKQRGLSQRALAAKVGISQQTIHYLIHPRSGEPAKSRFVADIAAQLNVSPSWLATGQGLPTGADTIRSNGGDVRRIPLLAKNRVTLHKSAVADFKPGEEDDYITDSGSPECFAMVVDDGANAPALQRGDYIVIDPKFNARPGQYVVATTKIGVFIRKYRPLNATQYELVPIHEDHPMFRSGDESAPRIIGAVIEQKRYWL